MSYRDEREHTFITQALTWLIRHCKERPEVPGIPPGSAIEHRLNQLLEAFLRLDSAIDRRLNEIKDAIALSDRRIKKMFEDLEAKVTKIVNAADAMELVLEDVKKRLDAIIAGGGIPPDQLAKLQGLSDALDKEADDIVEKTLANTPAATT